MWREVADAGFSACSALLDAKVIWRRRLRPLEIDCFSLEELAESRLKLEKDLFDAEFGSLMVLTSSDNGSETSVISEVSSCILETNASSLSSRRMGLARLSTGI